MIRKFRSYRSCNDEVLTALLKESDRQAFEEIYERHWRNLYSETYKRLKNTELIEEVMQDVFSNLWTSRGQRDIQKLYPYLLTCVRYQVFMLFKKGRTTLEFEGPVENLVLADLQADSLYAEKELKGCINMWMSMQPEKRRTIFRMKYMNEQSTKEICEILGISQKTVQNQLVTSFTHLRTFLTKFMVMLTLL